MLLLITTETGTVTEFKPGGGEIFRNFFRNSEQISRKRNKTQEKETKLKKKEQNSRIRNKTQEKKGTKLKKKGTKLKKRNKTQEKEQNSRKVTKPKKRYKTHKAPGLGGGRKSLPCPPPPPAPCGRP